MILFYICIFFIGAATASFINATLYRIDNDFKYPEIITKRSQCEHCNRTLDWISLIPVLGYLIRKGKCPNCGNKISGYYPLSEFLLGMSFVLFILYSIPFYYFLLLIFLFILSYYDVNEFGIPKTLTHIFLGLAVVIFLYLFFTQSISLLNLVPTTALVLLLILLNFIKKSFGLGDILILFGIGIFFTPLRFIIFFWLCVILALFYSLITAAIKRKKIKGMKVPMLPFITIAFVITIIFGETLSFWLLYFAGI